MLNLELKAGCLMPEQNERSFLEERKAEYLAELRRREPELIAKFLKVTAAIEAFNSTETTEITAVDEYANIFKPLDAIESYLDKTGKPAARETIAKSLEDGGWGKGRVQRPYWNILSILEYHLGPKFKSERRFQEINGRVGRIEWPDEDFTQGS
jgi:hypothetical protein